MARFGFCANSEGGGGGKEGGRDAGRQGDRPGVGARREAGTQGDRECGREGGGYFSFYSVQE